MSKDKLAIRPEMNNTPKVEMDYDGIYRKAVTIFADQASINKDPDDINLRDLEISKQKANNLLDSINGMLEMGHQVEILKEDHNKFKRKRELNVLHSLNNTCEITSLALEQCTQKATERLMKAMEDLDEDTGAEKMEEIASLQALLQVNIDSAQKIVNTYSTLLKTERQSGGRPWGNIRTSNTSVQLIESLDSGDTKKAKNKPREISYEELRALAFDKG